jgi:hypothetical protein
MKTPPAHTQRLALAGAPTDVSSRSGAHLPAGPRAPTPLCSLRLLRAVAPAPLGRVAPAPLGSSASAPRPSSASAPRPSSASAPSRHPRYNAKT